MCERTSSGRADGAIRERMDQAGQPLNKQYKPTAVVRRPDDQLSGQCTAFVHRVGSESLTVAEVRRRATTDCRVGSPSGCVQDRNK